MKVIIVFAKRVAILISLNRRKHSSASITCSEHVWLTIHQRRRRKMKISSFFLNCALGFDARSELREIASTFDAEECKAWYSAGGNGLKNRIIFLLTKTSLDHFERHRKNGVSSLRQIHPARLSWRHCSGPLRGQSPEMGIRCKFSTLQAVSVFATVNYLWFIFQVLEVARERTTISFAKMSANASANPTGTLFYLPASCLPSLQRKWCRILKICTAAF